MTTNNYTTDKKIIAYLAKPLKKKSESKHPASGFIYRIQGWLLSASTARMHAVKCSETDMTKERLTKQYTYDHEFSNDEKKTWIENIEKAYFQHIADEPSTMTKIFLSEYKAEDFCDFNPTKNKTIPNGLLKFEKNWYDFRMIKDAIGKDKYIQFTEYPTFIIIHNSQGFRALIMCFRRFAEKKETAEAMAAKAMLLNQERRNMQNTRPTIQEIADASNGRIQIIKV